MKRLVCLLMAAAMLTSCSSKKSSGVSEPPPDDTAVESPIIEYNASDFKEVEMPLQIDDKAPELPIHRLDISKLDFGKKLSPCNDPANNHRVIGMEVDANGTTSYIYSDSDESYGDYTGERVTITSIDTIDNGSIRYNYSDGSVSYGPPNVPMEGTVVNYHIDGDCIYMVVIYDVLCYGAHCFSIFRYEESTQKLDELYSYSGMEPLFSANAATTIIGGKLYYFSDDNSIYSMDFKNNNKIEKVYTIPEGSILWMNHKENTIVLGTLLLNENGETQINSSGDGNKLIYYYYNVKTGEVTTKDSEQTFNYDIWAGFQDDSSQNWSVEKSPQDNTDIIVTNNMRFNTGFKNVEVINADDKQVTFIESTTYSSTSVRRLHSFDLNKNEDTMTNVTIIGDQFYNLEGNLLSYSSGHLFYFVPKLGVAFRIPLKNAGQVVQSEPYNGLPSFIVNENRDIKYGENNEFVQSWDKSVELMWIDK